MSKYKTTPEETSGLPRGVKYIIGNEAAERFSFYGMRTILVVFMTRYLHLMSDGGVGGPMTGAEANEAYHNFVTWVYFFPVIGSLLSDILIGKYRTILWLSIVYCFGHLALAFIGEGGLSAEQWMWVGLLLISIGAGGIKPCVSAHVGDQFGKRNSHLMTMVYQWFYFSVNLGSTLSTALTPVLLKWYGPHVAFGVPGVLMALATLMFWMGRHVFIHVPPSGMKFFSETFSKDGLLALAKLSIVYAFVAVFWAVFDQTGSSWVLQAENMDRRFLWVDWLESQIQVVNPILVMAFIPVFQFVIYPNVEKVFRLTSIRKIGIGLFLTAGSFALLTVAQGLIDRGQTPSIAWQLWAYVLLTAGEIMISIT
ncbi:MAG: MFS transporter, partial [Planctomycetales bacterium]|nr:MFS transporter [Planctomycetales bacterium]